MAAFEFQALDSQGKKNKGVLEADNARHARQILRERKLTPLAVELAARRRWQSRPDWRSATRLTL